MKNLYEILGVAKNATAEEIKDAHHKKAMEYIDSTPVDENAEKKLKEVAEAYEILSDPKKRKRYDEGRPAKSRKSKKTTSEADDTKTEAEDAASGWINGDFYSINYKGKIFIDDAKLVDFIESKGWRWIKTGGVKTLVRIIGNMVEESDAADVAYFIRHYLKNGLPYYIGNGANRDQLCAKVIANSKNLFDKVRFDFLRTTELHFVEDTVDTSYLFYSNGAVKATSNGVELIPYNSIDGAVWKHDIIQRDFRLESLKPLEAIVEQFLFHICNKDAARYRSLISLIGYMFHRYKDPANAFAVMLVDEKVGDAGDANGGTGKSLVTRIFEHVRSTMVIPGKNFNVKRNFALQRLKPGTSILVIQDISSTENFENYFNMITDGITVEEKYKGERYIPFAESPKQFMTGNNVMKAPIGESTDRRKKEFEVSDYYSTKYTPYDEFKHRLFLDWGEAEWNKFDNFAVKSLRFYLKFGVIDPPMINLAERRIMQDVGEELVEMLDGMLLNGDTRFHKKKIHETFIKAYPDLRIYYRSPNKITKKMKRYFVHRGIKFVEEPANTKDYLVIKNDKAKINGTIITDSTGVSSQSNGEAVVDVKLIRTIKDVKHKYKVVDTAEKRQALIAELEKQICFAFDTETTGLDYATLEIVGLSLSFKAHEAYYVPLPVDDKEAKKILAEFVPVFDKEDVEMVAHNSKFDRQVLKKYDIEIRGKVFDTLLAHYLCWTDNKKHGLKPVTLELLNYQQLEYEELLHKYATTSIREVPLHDLAEYAAEDADFTLQLKPLLEKELTDKGLMELFHNVEVPLAEVLGDMEAEGIRVDDKALREVNIEAIAELKEIAAKVYDMAGEVFNLNSTRQLSRILFDKLGIEPQGEKGDSGAYSTAEDTLDKLKEAHPIVKQIIKYKKLSTLSSTFLEKLPNQVNPFTGRVHTHFNQAVTSTGRLSSSDPNLQNIPRQKGGDGERIRKAFVPRDENHILVAADYSQVELRIATHFSGDETLIDAYRRGDDIHSLTAAKVFGVPVEDITKDDYRRKVAKAVSFGLIYGMSAFTLAQRLTKETNKPVSEEDAKEIVESYFSTYPGVKRYQEEAIYDAVTKGYAETLMGRKRYLPEIHSVDSPTRSFAERKATNTPIQGSSADIIKVAMIRIHNEIKERGLRTRMVLQIHDELLFDVPKEEVERVIQMVLEKMEAAVTLKVPLIVDIGQGDSWQEAH